MQPQHQEDQHPVGLHQRPHTEGRQIRQYLQYPKTENLESTPEAHQADVRIAVQVRTEATHQATTAAVLQEVQVIAEALHTAEDIAVAATLVVEAEEVTAGVHQEVTEDNTKT